jgi:hypothetical protein
MTVRAPTLMEHIIQEAGATAYVACLRAGKVKHRTQRLGLSRPPYDVNYAAAASDAVKAYLAEALPAIAMEAATAGETPKSGSTRSATARVRKDIAQTPSPNLSQGDTP